MPINLDNISFYSAPAQVVRPSAANGTIRQTLGLSCSKTGRAAISSLDDTTTARDEITSQSDKKPIVSSRSLSEATIHDTVTPKDTSYLQMERCPASGNMGHGPAEELVAVNLTTHDNSPGLVAWSANDLPASLPSLPSGNFAVTMFPSHPGPQVAENSTDPGLPQHSTEIASVVTFETPPEETAPSYTEKLPQRSQAANNDFITWLQRQQVVPSSSGEAGETSGSPRRTAEKFDTMQRPSLTELGLPYSSLAPPGQDTPYRTENYIRQLISGQETLNPMPNVDGSESSPGSTNQSEPLLTEAAFHSSNWLPSADEMHIDAETIAPDTPRAALSPVRRRARKSRLPAGAYAEVDSEPDPSDKDGADRTSDDCVGDQANAAKTQMSQKKLPGDFWNQQSSESTRHVIKITIRAKTKVRAGHKATKNKWNHDSAGLSCFYR
ncbi:hypothetical protein CORC01_09784 [Colletotrichum orchidophilum]|uniref:Uncharacterized protein n=1 Tax=Colletotrichum orchidophilum TaxID=1209926 RepID=A0A1G4B0K0_9PEZI|nr:uncharacterized protein CORC01_09784 [Colletotrichum orchidophilum]OHE94865.1 hypothetical protein CORC01_09784 [Colletotrichum orchidophilum]